MIPGSDESFHINHSPTHLNMNHCYELAVVETQTKFHMRLAERFENVLCRGSQDKCVSPSNEIQYATVLLRLKCDQD
jgi:hypothetical protein